jgi:hypothetical protein
MVDMEETAGMAEMAEKDGVPVVTETAMGLTLVPLVLLVLVLVLVLLVVMIATAATTAAVLLEDKPYIIPPLDAPTWTAP